MISNVKIGACWYTVKIDNQKLDYMEAVGASAGNDLEILMRDDKPPDTEKETMVHEILHQCLFQSGFQTSTLSLLDSAELQEEMIVRHMSAVLFGVIRENPELIAWLTKA